MASSKLFEEVALISVTLATDMIGPPVSPVRGEEGYGLGGTSSLLQKGHFQSAMNTFVSPSRAALRLEAKTSFRPSGENIGNPSNDSPNVICSSPVPSTLTKKMSKLLPRGFFAFDA